jgi:hypothetical protein
MRWWIINVNPVLNVIRAYRFVDLPDRPADAQPREETDVPGYPDDFTPWTKSEEHIHTPQEDGMLGAHVRAESFCEAVQKTLAMLQKAGLPTTERNPYG